VSIAEAGERREPQGKISATCEAFAKSLLIEDTPVETWSIVVFKAARFPQFSKNHAR
jgi:hypothetical protein